MRKNCWIFCTVIDHFGDIGVAWRLAREISQRTNWRVSLWLDNWHALQKICPNVTPLPCTHQNIELRHWQEGISADLSDSGTPHIVIETFACHLPPSVENIIQQSAPLWLNWEYLSAEKWAVRTHKMPSLQHNSSQKYFWQMGFLEETGGLLREQDYQEKFNHFQQDKNIQQQYRQQFKLPAKRTSDEIDCLVFAYSNSDWQAQIQALIALPTTITLWLADQPVITRLKQQNYLPSNALQNDGDIWQDRNVRLVKIPFVAQSDFDPLLWLADGTIIRGEESFVRAQLAGKLLIWNAYPQEDLAHQGKLSAFWTMQQTITQTPQKFPQMQAALQQLSQDINQIQTLTPLQRQQDWRTLWQNWSQWQQSSRIWQQYLLNQSDTVSKLIHFIQENES